eukprot:jgi/Picsp_1/1232/NSC_04713-R1_family
MPLDKSLTCEVVNNLRRWWKVHDTGMKSVSHAIQGTLCFSSSACAQGKSDRKCHFMLGAFGYRKGLFHSLVKEHGGSTVSVRGDLLTERVEERRLVVESLFHRVRKTGVVSAAAAAASRGSAAAAAGQDNRGKATSGASPSGDCNYPSTHNDDGNASSSTVINRDGFGSTLESSTVNIQGVIKKVNYRASESGYTVMRVSVSNEYAESIPDVALGGVSSSSGYSRMGQKKQGSVQHSSVTVVGILPVLHVGQHVSVEGSWTTHPTYGMQLRASTVTSSSPSGSDDLIAFLSGGAIHGVGPATAVKMVDTWGDDILSVLDSDDAVKKLQLCEGIGRNKAVAIKTAWDSGRDARKGAQFLCDAGIPAGPAQRIAETYGSETEAKVLRDPYSTLNRFGISLDAIENFAVQSKCDLDLISRVALVMTKCLMVCSNRDGHTYVTWDELERLTKKRLEDLSRKFNGAAGPGVSISSDALRFIAWQMCNKGSLVCEAESNGGLSLGILNQPMSDQVYSIEEIRNILSKGMTKRQLDALISTYGENVANVLSQEDTNAVSDLKNVSGIGPKTAEKILHVWRNINSNENVSSYPNASQAAIRINELVENPPNQPCEWSTGTRCYLPQFHKAETVVAECAVSKSSLIQDVGDSRRNKIRQWIDVNQKSTNVVLSEGQKAAIEMASDSPILVITGGPGCGKTTVLQSIVKLWCAQGKVVHICAPTGRAAQRIGAIQYVEPSTIHRLLKYRPNGSTDTDTNSLESLDEDEIDFGEMEAFELGPDNKLESDAVLVDEASMLSLPLAAALMQALQTKTQLILVGDVDQLPPVGPGGILDAMISSGVVPVIDLREIFRQEATSSIVTSALAVRSGQYPSTADISVEKASSQLSSYIPSDGSLVLRTKGDVIPIVKEAVSAIAARPGVPLGSIQVISPMRKGPLGVNSLNPILQHILNPPGLGKLEISRGDTVLRLGDRVLQLHNDYDKDVYNGDQGTIVDVDPVSNKILVQFEKGFGNTYQVLEYSGMDLAHLDLAYAVTVHKAQGGEAEHVVMVLSPQHGRLLTRPLLYTGITRAKDLLVMVLGNGGSVDPLESAITTIGMETRQSTLVERLVSLASQSRIKSHEVISFYDQDSALNGAFFSESSAENPILTKTEELIDIDGPDEEGTTSAIVEEQVDTTKLITDETLQEHIDMVALQCTNGHATREQVLQFVPYISMASKDYLTKSIEFSDKISSSRDSSPDGTGSLVMQLANLRHAWLENKLV